MWSQIDFPPSVSKQLVSGLIHSTYQVGGKGGSQGQYILQRINTHVFGDLAAIEGNIQIIGDYLERNVPDYLFVRALSGHDGRIFQTDPDDGGAVWRLQPFVSDSEVYEAVTSEELAYRAAGAFALLTKHLADCPTHTLKESIPAFHSMEKYANQLNAAIKNATPERLKAAKKCLAVLNQYDHIKQLAEQMMLRTDLFPVRIMHHDAKMSNVLFGAGTRDPLCVIDLDTMMPGKIYSDIGDLMRSSACVVSESEATEMATEVEVRRSYLSAVLEGYREVMDAHLGAEEKQYLPKAGQIMTYMQAIRFLTDYLMGDQYYSIAYATHNLDRTTQHCNMVRAM
jgi:Ser/Thr protein kinase RdoA (MazF antagonist)